MSIEIRQLNYIDILKIEPTFVSLDISVRSSGWVKSINGKVEYGTYSIETEDELDRRREFRKFLIDLLGDVEYSTIYVEDVIAGTNFKTTKGLIQLNTIVDDLAADNVIKVKEIKRVDNKVWKKYLKQLAKYESIIKKENDKVLIKNCLNILGFDEDVKQDIYDAMGVAVSMIYRYKVLKEKPKTAPLKMDLKRGYKIKQVNTLEKLRTSGKKEAETKKREIEEIDWAGQSRDILYLFKQKIKADQEDDKVYLITLNSSKLGILALTKKLNTEEEITYLMVTKNK